MSASVEASAAVDGTARAKRRDSQVQREAEMQNQWSLENPALFEHLSRSSSPRAGQSPAQPNPKPHPQPQPSSAGQQSPPPTSDLTPPTASARLSLEAKVQLPMSPQFHADDDADNSPLVPPSRQRTSSSEEQEYKGEEPAQSPPSARAAPSNAAFAAATRLALLSSTAFSPSRTSTSRPPSPGLPLLDSAASPLSSYPPRQLGKNRTSNSVAGDTDSQRKRRMNEHNRPSHAQAPSSSHLLALPQSRPASASSSSSPPAGSAAPSFSAMARVATFTLQPRPPTPGSSALTVQPIEADHMPVAAGSTQRRFEYCITMPAWVAAKKAPMTDEVTAEELAEAMALTHKSAEEAEADEAEVLQTAMAIKAAGQKLSGIFLATTAKLTDAAKKINPLHSLVMRNRLRAAEKALLHEHHFNVLYKHLCARVTPENVLVKENGEFDKKNCYICITASLETLEELAEKTQMMVRTTQDDFHVFDKVTKREGTRFAHPNDMDCPYRPNAAGGAGFKRGKKEQCRCDIFVPYQRQELVRMLVEKALDDTLAELNGVTDEQTPHGQTPGRGFRELKQRGILNDMFPLHWDPDCNFYKSRVTILKEYCDIHVSYKTSFSFTPKSEELIHWIRDYCGEKISLYFSFLHFYNSCLLILSVAGLGPALWQYVDKTDNPLVVIYCLFVIFWSAFMMKFWNRKNADWAFEWNMMEYENQEREMEAFIREQQSQAVLLEEEFKKNPNAPTALALRGLPPNARNSVSAPSFSINSGSGLQSRRRRLSSGSNSIHAHPATQQHQPLSIEAYGFYEKEGRWVDLEKYAAEAVKKYKDESVTQFIPRSHRDVSGRCPSWCLGTYGMHSASGYIDRLQLNAILWRALKEALGAGVISTLIMAVIVFTLSLLVFRLIATQNYAFRGQLVAGVANAVSIYVLDQLYRHVAFKMNCWENHRTATQFEDKLVSKVFVFQFINGYFALFYIAFFKQASRSTSFTWFGYADHCSDEHGEDADSCMGELSSALMSIVVIRVGISYLTQRLIPKWKTKAQMAEKLMANDVEKQKQRKEVAKETRKKEKQEKKKKELEKKRKKKEAAAGDLKELALRAKAEAEAQHQLEQQQSEAKLAGTSSGSSNRIFPLQLQSFTNALADQAPTMLDPRLLFKTIPKLNVEYQAFQPKFEMNENVSAVFQDYNELAIGYGYVVLFAPAFPIAPALMLAHNIVENSTDSVKILKNSQRCRYYGASDIGSFYHVFIFLTLLSILTNTGIIVFTSTQLDYFLGHTPDVPSRIVSGIIFEHVCGLIVFIIFYSIADMRPGLRETLAFNDQVKKTESDYAEWLSSGHLAAMTSAKENSPAAVARQTSAESTKAPRRGSAKGADLAKVAVTAKGTARSAELLKSKAKAGGAEGQAEASPTKQAKAAEEPKAEKPEDKGPPVEMETKAETRMQEPSAEPKKSRVAGMFKAKAKQDKAAAGQSPTSEAKKEEKEEQKEEEKEEEEQAEHPEDEKEEQSPPPHVVVQVNARHEEEPPSPPPARREPPSRAPFPSSSSSSSAFTRPTLPPLTLPRHPLLPAAAPPSDLPLLPLTPPPSSLSSSLSFHSRPNACFSDPDSGDVFFPFTLCPFRQLTERQDCVVSDWCGVRAEGARGARGRGGRRGSATGGVTRGYRMVVARSGDRVEFTLRYAEGPLPHTLHCHLIAARHHDPSLPPSSVAFLRSLTHTFRTHDGIGFPAFATLAQLREKGAYHQDRDEITFGLWISGESLAKQVEEEEAQDERGLAAERGRGEDEEYDQHAHGALDDFLSAGNLTERQRERILRERERVLSPEPRNEEDEREELLGVTQRRGDRWRASRLPPLPPPAASSQRMHAPLLPARFGSSFLPSFFRSSSSSSTASPSPSSTFYAPHPSDLPHHSAGVPPPPSAVPFPAYAMESRTRMYPSGRQSPQFDVYAEEREKEREERSSWQRPRSAHRSGPPPSSFYPPSLSHPSSYFGAPSAAPYPPLPLLSATQPAPYLHAPYPEPSSPFHAPPPPPSSYTHYATGRRGSHGAAVGAAPYSPPIPAFESDSDGEDEQERRLRHMRATHDQRRWR